MKYVMPAVCIMLVAVVVVGLSISVLSVYMQVTHYKVDAYCANCGRGVETIERRGTVRPAHPSHDCPFCLNHSLEWNSREFAP